MNPGSNSKATLRIVSGVAFAVVVALSVLALRPGDTKDVHSGSSLASDPSKTSPSAIKIDKTPSDKSEKKAETSEAVEPLTMLGTVLPDAQRSLSTSQPARIRALDIHVGDSVRQGQILVLLDNLQGRTQEQSARVGITTAEAQLHKAEMGHAARQAEEDANVTAAQAGLKLAQTKLNQATLARDAARDDLKANLTAARENVGKAELGLKTAQRTLHSLEELDKVGGVSRNDLEGARTQVTNAQTDLKQAKEQAARLTAGPHPGVSYQVATAQQGVDEAQGGVDQANIAVETAKEARKKALALTAADVDLARTGLQQAKTGLEGAQSLEQSAELSSPISGIVVAVGAHTGETAQPGVALVTIASVGIHVEALATAGQLSRLHTGQAARIALNTRRNWYLQAQISEIARTAEPDGRNFRIKFRLPTPLPELRLGQSVRISLP